MKNIITQKNSTKSNALERIRPHNTKKHLTKARQIINNIALTENSYTHSQALNMAFFVPKNHQEQGLNPLYWLSLSIKKQVHILKYGRVKAWNIRPNLLGNICNRIRAISNTRSPVTKAGGLTKNSYGGQTMPLNTSNGGYIRQIQAKSNNQSNKCSNALERIRPHNIKKPLTKARQIINNVVLTENYHTQCQALNMAFFVPKNRQGWVLNPLYWLNLSIKKQVHILKYGRVKAWNIILNLLGNICSRVIAISDTRSPSPKLGGLTENYHGGQPMPLNTPNGGYIRQIQAVATSNGIQASIYTKHRQTQAINGLFSSMANLRQFIQKQGINPSLVNWRVA